MAPLLHRHAPDLITVNDIAYKHAHRHNKMSINVMHACLRIYKRVSQKATPVLVFEFLSSIVKCIIIAIFYTTVLRQEVAYWLSNHMKINDLR